MTLQKFLFYHHILKVTKSHFRALSRMIPVIIFKDIKHVIHKRSGIFVSERNEKSLEKTIEFINKNYEMIKKE